MKASWRKYTLDFKRPSGTSRGIMDVKDSYFLFLKEGGGLGIGECGLLRGLSADDRPDYEEKLDWLVAEIDRGSALLEELNEFPSIRAGLEMALLDYHAEDHELFPSEFTAGLDRQPINGLVWMGRWEDMAQQVEDLLQRGFLVIKMKIGALAFEEELKIIRKVRERYSAAEVQIRVDANGAFSPVEALAKLEQLDALRVHSIEQPIKAEQRSAMARLCERSPLPIALDEELIGIHERVAKAKLLDQIKPAFLVLKPSLLGGFASCEEWIELAEERCIGWWVTSALESNVGLSAIAQWNYNLYGPLASGLGTGSLYTNNFPSPLKIVRGTLAYDPEKVWDLSLLTRT